MTQLNLSDFIFLGETIRNMQEAVKECDPDKLCNECRYYDSNSEHCVFFENGFKIPCTWRKEY